MNFWDRHVGNVTSRKKCLFLKKKLIFLSLEILKAVKTHSFIWYQVFKHTFNECVIQINGKLL